MRHLMTTLLVALIGLAAMFTPVQAVLQESKVPESAVPVYGRLMPAQAVNVDHNFRIRQNKGIRSFGSGVVPRLLSPTGRNAASDDGHAVSVMGALLDQNSPGVYSYSFKDNTFTPVALSDDLFANGNAILAGDTYYCFYVDGSEGRYFVYINKFNIDTWEKTGTGYAYIQDVPIDMAVDPVSGKIYGCFPKDGMFTSYVWAQYNTTTYTRAQICVLPRSLAAVAADAKGQFYGIDCDGNLYKVHKETGELTLVGSTGLILSEAAQSAAFDLQFNHLYLSAELSDGTTGLWRINTATAHAELINKFPGNEILMGIYVPSLEADLGAPDRVANLSLNFIEGSSTGTVNFTMPKNTFGGKPLTGPVNYSVKANDLELKKGSASASEQVSVSVTAPVGYVRFTVTASNSNGAGPEVESSTFIGSDAPVAVGDLKAEKGDNGQINITWSAPETTVNGGYFDPDELMYTVRRMPDNKFISMTAATVCTDIVKDEAMASYTYEVTASAGDKTGPAAMSNAVVTGSYCGIPWGDDFSSEITFPLYTVINVAGDKYTWEYRSDWNGNRVLVDYDFNNPKDDWLFTPPLMMEADHIYKLRFTTKSKRALPEIIEVRFGGAPTVDDMSVQLVEPTTITSEDYSNTDVNRAFEVYIDPGVTGKKYIGFHAMSEPQMSRLEIHSIEVTEAGLALAPEAPADIRAVPGGNGILQAEVSFMAPAKAINGSDLSEITKIEIYVNGEIAKTVNGTALNTLVSATVPTRQGDNEIRVKAHNAAGPGLEAVTSVYTGVVVPDVVRNIKAAYVDGKIELGWEPPLHGDNGGYVDSDALTYMIVRSDQAILAYNHEGTSITDDLSSFKLNGQGIVSYAIFPRNVAGTGYGAYSNGIVLGDVFFELPFKESFPKGFTSNTPWGIISTTETGWFMTQHPRDVPNFDEDDGMAMFVPRGPEESCLIYTGRFRLAETVNPVISLMYYNDGENTTRLDLQYTTDYAEFKTLATVNLSDPSIPVGWNELKVPLADIKNSEPFIAFGFLATSAKEDWAHHLYMDCIRVYDDLDHNLVMEQLNSPGSIAFGTSAVFGGIVSNKGKETATDYTIDLYCNGEILATVPGPSLSQGQMSTFELEATPKFEHIPAAMFKAVINYQLDQNMDNNSSDERKIIITLHDYPTVTDLGGSVDDSGDIVLSWSKPASGSAPEQTHESFEDYIPFIIEDIGDWTLVDVNGDSGTFGITYGGTAVEFMNSTYPHAYQVFNPEKCGMASSQIGIDALMPHSGKQYLVSFQDIDGQNDDWLISPELSGDAQTISFYAKTPIPNSGFDTFEVYYSMSDKDIDSFIKVNGIKEEAFKNWEQVAFNVPDGARYFAIRHTSQDKFLLAIDDISFVKKDAKQAPLEVAGYYVYRDDVKVATLTNAVHTFKDNVRDGKEHSYAVTVNYTHGESGYSNIVNVMASSVSEINCAAPYVVGVKGGIAVNNAAGKQVYATTADGKLVICTCAASDRTVYPANPGIYVVNIGEDTFKVVVK